MMMAQSAMRMNVRSLKVERWITSSFARGLTPPFSFVYGNKPSAQFIRKWKHSLSKLPSEEPNQLKYLATYTDPSTGMQAECEVTGWTDFGTIEWVLRFRHTGTVKSPRISHVRTVDMGFLHPDATPVVYYANGSDASRADFAPQQKILNPVDTREMIPRG